MPLSVIWVDLHYEPACPPNPQYPDGMDIDVSAGAARTCFTALPYPAPRCGWFLVRCADCGQSVIVTTAGRPDDPRSVRIACGRRIGAAESGVLSHERASCH